MADSKVVWMALKMEYLLVGLMGEMMVVSKDGMKGLYLAWLMVEWKV